MSGKFSRSCDNCDRRVRARFRTIAGCYLCDGCAEFFRSHNRLRDPTEVARFLASIAENEASGVPVEGIDDLGDLERW